MLCISTTAKSKVCVFLPVIFLSFCLPHQGKLLLFLCILKKILFLQQTHQNDAILLYATGENLENLQMSQFISASITSANELLLSFNLGEGTLSLKMGANLTNNQWHVVTIDHKDKFIHVSLDNHTSVKEVLSSRESFYFYLDPFIFLGGVPNLNKGQSL